MYMPYAELLSLFTGALAGFVFKFMAQRAADRQAQFEMFIKTIQEKDVSADKAAARSNDAAGQWARRLIVIAILFGVILAPFIMTLIGKPVSVEVQTPVKEHLFGLFSTGGKTVYYELQSYLLIPEVRQALMAIVGFYFGQGAAKK
jgi:hypothetical protein